MPLIIILSLVATLAIVAGIMIYARSRGPSDPLQDRLEKFGSRETPVTLEEIEMSQSLYERVFLPILRRFSEFAARFTPQATLEAAERSLRQAGITRVGPTEFVVLRIGFAVIITILMFFVLLTAPGFRNSLGQVVLYTLIIAGIMYMVPQLYVSSKAARRRKDVFKALPDALDLITICVEAGLGFDGALNKVAEKWDNELSDAFARVLHEQSLGKSRRDALRDLSDRMEVPELTSFIAAVLQAEQLGVSLGRVLRIQSDQMRIKRRQRAEAEAHRAPIKMLLPMAGCIFPSLFIILLGPAVFILLNSGAMGVFGF